MNIKRIFNFMVLAATCNAAHASAQNYYCNGASMNSGSIRFYPNGSEVNYGSLVYYPNGDRINYDSIFYYPNGERINYGSIFYYPNGERINYGETCYYSNGTIMGSCPTQIVAAGSMGDTRYLAYLNLNAEQPFQKVGFEQTLAGVVTSYQLDIAAASIDILWSYCP